MLPLWIALAVILFIALVIAIVAFLCYKITFYAPPRKPGSPEPDVPEGKIYEPYHEQMRLWAKETRALPQEDFSIISRDGLRLTAKYYEFAPGAPIELMFHGYRGSAQRDLSGGVQRCFQIRRSAFLVDQRCSSTSEGKTITFGIREHQDCLDWVDFMVEHFGPDVKIILTGVSMGAATVLMAAGKPLPPNVIGVLADCGYTSAREIIQEVARRLKLPAKMCYPFVRLGARLYGGFDPDSYSPLEAVKNCKVPVIFYHGDTDDFVPWDMSRRNYEACASKKLLITVPGAGHGLCFPVDPDGYLKALEDFFGPEASHA